MPTIFFWPYACQHGLSNGMVAFATGACSAQLRHSNTCSRLPPAPELPCYTTLPYRWTFPVMTWRDAGCPTAAVRILQRRLRHELEPADGRGSMPVIHSYSACMSYGVRRLPWRQYHFFLIVAICSRCHLTVAFGIIAGVPWRTYGGVFRAHGLRGEPGRQVLPTGIAAQFANWDRRLPRRFPPGLYGRRFISAARCRTFNGSNIVGSCGWRCIKA